MNKTLADLMVLSRTERIQLPKRGTKQPSMHRVHAPDVVSTNGAMSLIKVPWQHPTIERLDVSPGESQHAITRFVPGPHTIDLYVLGEHRHAKGDGHRMHVYGFVPSPDHVSTYPSGELSEAFYLPARELRGTLHSFERELTRAGLPGRLGDYILGQKASPSLMNVHPTALSLSLSQISIDRSIVETIKSNPALEPYAGSIAHVFFGRPGQAKH